MQGGCGYGAGVFCGTRGGVSAGDPEVMFFDGWFDIFRVLVVGLSAYVAIVALLRISGKRTLSKMNMFGFVVTVAFGSLLAGTMLNDSVSVSEGVAGMVVLIGGQFVVTWLSVRSEGFMRIVKAEPTLLFHGGEYLEDRIRSERVTREEVLCAARSQRLDGLEDCHSVILETDGTLNVVRNENPDMPGSLKAVASV